MKKSILIMAAVAAVSVVNAGIISDVALDSSSAASGVNLTAGTTDWVMLGQGGVAGGGLINRSEKVGVGYIGEVTVDGSLDSYIDSEHDFSWTDGDTATGTGIGAATAVSGDWEAKPDGGAQNLSFSVGNLAVGDYTMNLYSSAYKAAQLLTASIGASTDSYAIADNGGPLSTVYSIDFTIETLGESMDIFYETTAISDVNYSNVGISAISVSPVGVVPEPATLGLIVAFGGGMIFIRRRFMI
jgi:hypothetical protein